MGKGRRVCPGRAAPTIGFAVAAAADSASADPPAPRAPLRTTGSPGDAGIGEARLSGSASGMDHYYDKHELAGFARIGEHAPALGERFFAWYAAVFEDGALSAREKSLIALGVAHAVQCPYCIDAYTQDALSKGCDVEQLTEAVHVAAAIRGGASLVHGMQMRRRADELGM